MMLTENRIALMLIMLCLVFAFGCGQADSTSEDDTEVPSQNDGDDDNEDDDDDDDFTPSCDDTVTPIVFAHGYLEQGDAFANQTMLFGSSGYCIDRIFAYDWNTFEGYDDEPGGLEIFIDQVLAKTGATQVDLIGHSMGGRLVHMYVEKSENAAKVAHAAALASFGWDDVPNDVLMINIVSTADTMTSPDQVPGAHNVIFDDLDHLQVASAPEVFEELYRFFNDDLAPSTTEVVPEDNSEISGRAVVFAENSPAPGWKINAWRIDPSTGERLTAQPEGTFTVDADGFWGPMQPQPGAHYEFELTDPALEWPPIHYYRLPFARSNNKVYFRVFPPKASLMGFAFSLLPYNDENALFAWLNLNRSVLQGRDSFFVNGVDLVVDGLADPEATTIAIFFIDMNFNKQSENLPLGGIFASFPFIRIVDMYIPAQPIEEVPIQFNDDAYSIRNWPSRTDGISIAVFE